MYCTGESDERISSRTSSVGMPRSITHTRRALPYWRSMRARKSRNVVFVLGVARHHVVGERQPLRRDHQRNDHLHAVRSFIARIAKTALILRSASKYVLVRS